MSRHDKFVTRGLPVLLGLMLALAGVGNSVLLPSTHTGANPPAVYTSSAELACIQSGEC